MSAKIPNCTIEMKSGSYQLKISGALAYEKTETLTATSMDSAFVEAQNLLASNYNSGYAVPILNQKITPKVTTFEAVLSQE